MKFEQTRRNFKNGLFCIFVSNYRQIFVNNNQWNYQTTYCALYFLTFKYVQFKLIKSEIYTYSYVFI